MSGAAISSRNRFPLAAIPGTLPAALYPWSRLPHACVRSLTIPQVTHTVDKLLRGLLAGWLGLAQPSPAQVGTPNTSAGKRIRDERLTNDCGEDTSAGSKAKERYPRDDLNVRHTAPEAVALSGLSYGGTDVS